MASDDISRQRPHISVMLKRGDEEVRIHADPDTLNDQLITALTDLMRRAYRDLGFHRGGDDK